MPFPVNLGGGLVSRLLGQLDVFAEGRDAEDAATTGHDLPALLCGLAFRRWRGSTKVSNAVVGGLLSGLGVLLSALLLALLLASGGDSFFGVAKLAVVAHLPVMVVEGLVGGFVIAFLFRVKPEVLGPRTRGRQG